MTTTHDDLPSIEEVDANWESYPQAKLDYEQGERGWVREIVPNRYYGIDNDPLTLHLAYKDVVTAVNGCVKEIVRQRWPRRRGMMLAEPHEESGAVVIAIVRRMNLNVHPTFAAGVFFLEFTEDAEFAAVVQEAGKALEQWEAEGDEEFDSRRDAHIAGA